MELVVAKSAEEGARREGEGGEADEQVAARMNEGAGGGRKRREGKHGQ